MTIYGQTLVVIKHDNNECIRNGEKTNRHEIKIAVFLFRICGAMTRISSRIASFWHHNDVFVTKYVSKHHICEIKKTTISCTLFSGEDISDGNINSRTLGDV